MLGQGSLTEGGRVSTFDLSELTSLDQFLFILKILFTFSHKLPERGQMY
jgi:hypothetical protein